MAEPPAGSTHYHLRQLIRAATALDNQIENLSPAEILEDVLFLGNALARVILAADEARCDDLADHADSLV